MKLTLLPLLKAKRLFFGLITFILIVGVGFLVVISYKSQLLTITPDVEPLQDRVHYGVTRPLPVTTGLDGAKVALGKKLFHDARLSANNTISCASCHNLSTGGVDRRKFSIGINGGVGVLNAPTVFNSSLNFALTWNGTASSLEDQMENPINNPKEMGSNWKQIIKKLGGDKDYVLAFDKIYQDGISSNNIKNAIATFERSLITPNSRFDKFLWGKPSAINSIEKKGYGLFQSYGCASCHQGVNLGGNMYEKMGLMGDYFGDRGNLTEADNGRFNVTREPEHLHEFRVPSLRNVAITAPYFHDGSAQTLEQAVAIMAKYQLGRPIPTEDTAAIVAFLKTLTGEYQGKPL